MSDLTALLNVITMQAERIKELEQKNNNLWTALSDFETKRAENMSALAVACMQKDHPELFKLVVKEKENKQ